MRAALAMAALGACALVYVLFAAASKPDAAGYGRFARGAMADLQALAEPPAQPAMALIGADGAQTTLAAHRGQVVVLNLWATWCAPCIEEMPTLAALQRQMGDRGVAVVAVSIDADSDAAKAQTMLADLGDGALAYYRDPTRAIAFAARAPGLPTTVIYARDGREIARLAGGADWASPEAIALIEAALADG
ncbi:MAG: TlpA disulfide reductase family protein [Hyphomonadaceae bacterium]|nr:TlpA disulfide reductase family protein [Hyphomonadaceae bacterium]